MTQSTLARACEALIKNNYDCHPDKYSLVIFPAAFVVGCKIFLTEDAANAWASETADGPVPRTVERIDYLEAYRIKHPHTKK